MSIDVLRGLTVAFMILVNNNGNNDAAFRALNHSPWNGFTPTDLVFPTFLFIMGISMVLSFRSRSQRGVSTVQHLLSIGRRFLLLFFLGLVVNGFPFFHLDTLRLYGVLQRIAVCYLFAALLLLVSDRVAPRVALFVALLIGYWALLRFVPVPGFGVPTHAIPLLDPDRNLVAFTDRHLLPGRLFEGTRDPEGLLSDLPAIASTLLGLVAGSWLRIAGTNRRRVLGFLGMGVGLLCAGIVWSATFPVNKKLWTSSYVLVAGGYSLLLLGASVYLVEQRQWKGRWTTPFLAFGTNAITAYVFSELLSTAVAVTPVNSRESVQQFVYNNFFVHLATPAIGSLLYSLLFVAVCFLPVLVLYRKRLFLKL